MLRIKFQHLPSKSVPMNVEEMSYAEQCLE